MKVYLDNLLLSKDDYQSGDFTKEIASKKDLQQNVTQEFTFFGNAYNKIMQNLIQNPLGQIKTLSLKVIDDCCSENVVFFEGEIKGNELEWCDDECSVTAIAYEKTEEDKVILCLRNHFIGDGNKIQNEKHQLVNYCNEGRPQFLHDMIIVLGLLGILIATILYPVITILAVIVGAISDLIGGRGLNVQKEVKLVKTIIQELRNAMFPCENIHPTPYVRTYLEDFCDKCGATLSSTIFNNVSSDKYNSLYFAAQTSEGIETKKYNKGVIRENLPLKTAEDFLNDFETLNIEWTVQNINGNYTLFVERKDFFDSTELLNLPVDAKTCYETLDGKPPAFAYVQFLEDGTDLVGNESKGKWYRHIQEWNLPVSDLQEGKKDYPIPFSPHRQISDGIRKTVYERYNGFLLQLFGFRLSNYKEWLLLHNGIAFNAKLLNWNPNRKRIEKFNQVWYAKNVYSSLLEIDNPRVAGYPRFSFTSKFSLDCDNYLAWLNASDKQVKTNFGIGKNINIEINATSKIITVSGKI